MSSHQTALRLTVNPEFPEPRKIRRAAEVLERGGVIAYPTDTTYGVGCSIFEKRGIDRIVRLKHLKKDHLFSFVCADLSDIARYAQVENDTYRLMRRLLPGPYTFILKATPMVPRMLQSKRKTVGIRVPDHPACLALAREFAKPILSTSAVFEGNKQRDAAEINLTLGHGLDCILDAGWIDEESSSDLSWIAV
jgi:tRNA threonylcarbamoyl adenosine modification protein (Sua5/YciO/YrdC/YwlC family)